MLTERGAAGKLDDMCGCGSQCRTNGIILACKCSCHGLGGGYVGPGLATEAACAKSRDGTIPLSEALEAVKRGEHPEFTFSKVNAEWFPFESDDSFTVHQLTDPDLRFRLAPPSRLKALVDADPDASQWTAYDKAATLRVAQAVTRDICTFLRELDRLPPPALPHAADAIERAYLAK